MAQAEQANEPNRKQQKKPGKNKVSHTANTQFGMGDSYGSAVKNPIGRMIEGAGSIPVTKKKLKKPPRSLA